MSAATDKGRAEIIALMRESAKASAQAVRNDPMPALHPATVSHQCNVVMGMAVLRAGDAVDAYHRCIREAETRRRERQEWLEFMSETFGYLPSDKEST